MAHCGGPTLPTATMISINSVIAGLLNDAFRCYLYALSDSLLFLNLNSQHTHSVGDFFLFVSHQLLEMLLKYSVCRIYYSLGSFQMMRGKTPHFFLFL